MDVKNIAERMESISYLDEYGYTPLIEAVIIDDVEKVDILLALGADVKQKDTTGRSALHWAVDNESFEICEHLLKKGADANSYNISSEPLLVKPILRHQDALKALLLEHGASPTFAYDYINAKMIGHQFELTGSVDIVASDGKFCEVDYEGFYLELSLDLIRFSLLNFRRNYAARSISVWFDRIDAICDALDYARHLQQYDHYLIKLKQRQVEIPKIVINDNMIIPISQVGHAMSIIRCGNLLAICDRAADSEPHDYIPIFYMNKPYKLTSDFIQNLMFQKHDIQTVHRLVKQELALHAITKLPMPDQVIGNCSWANVEAIIPSLKFMLALNDPSLQLSEDEKLADSLELYYRWHDWESSRTLQFITQEFKEATPQRKASIAALLAGVLFQKTSAEDPEHVERAKRIIKILKTKGYEYILESYLKFYARERKTKAGENLVNLLKIYERDEI